MGSCISTAKSTIEPQQVTKYRHPPKKKSIITISKSK